MYTKNSLAHPVRKLDLLSDPLESLLLLYDIFAQQSGDGSFRVQQALQIGHRSEQICQNRVCNAAQKPTG